MVIVDNTAEQRFETVVEGELSVLEYQIESGVIVLTHTGVPDAIRGRGIASALVKFALDQARTRHLQIVPACSYVVAWMRRYPQYDDLIAS